MSLVEETSRTLRLYSKASDADWSFEKGLLFPLVSGTDVNRYNPLPERQYILFPYKVENEVAELLDFNIISQKYPKTAAYLESHRKRLEGREGGKFKGRDWYRFGRNQNLGIQQRVKLCVPRLVENLYAAFDTDGFHFLDNVDVGGITLKPSFESQGFAYLLGLLNSTLLRWYFPFVSAPFRGGWMSANRQFLSRLPIRPINFSDSADRARHDRMVGLVERMLELHRRKAEAKGESVRAQLEREINVTDEQVDALVYELYGLSEDEIRIVEGGS
jgi:hypothetical protein